MMTLWCSCGFGPCTSAQLSRHTVWGHKRTLWWRIGYYWYAAKYAIRKPKITIVIGGGE